MVIVELAIAVVLLSGARLLDQSLHRLLHVALDFDPAHLATIAVMAPPRSTRAMKGRGLYWESLGHRSNRWIARELLLCDLPVRYECLTGVSTHGEVERRSGNWLEMIREVIRILSPVDC
jgi:hypothetical protein